MSIKYICEWCNKVFYGRARKHKHIFCSQECSRLFKQNTDLRQHSVNDLFFQGHTKNSMWLVGLLASDGNISKNKFVSVSQSGKCGLECLNYVKNLIKSSAPITKHRPKKGEDVYTLTINSHKIVGDLKKYNIVPNKTSIYAPSKQILENKNFLKYFICGYIDGDGCVGIYDVGGSRHLLKVSFVCSYNMLTTIITYLPYKPKYYRQGNVWCIYYNGERAYKFLNWIYSETEGMYLSYKYKIFQKFVKLYLKEQRFYKYNIIYTKCKKLFESRPELTGMDISKIVGIPFQTVYKYKRKWEEQKCNMKNATLV